jgi:PPOX class probable F420-dependent enzyme
VRRTEARERFASARVARLATVGEDGAPHLVPIVFVLLDETVYSVVDEKPKRSADLRRLANVRATGRAALLVDHYEDDWEQLWWVRADGHGRVLDPDKPEARRAIEALIKRYTQQRPVGAVLAVDVERWTGWLGGGGHSASG